jgi:hypothetical protein
MDGNDRFFHRSVCFLFRCFIQVYSGRSGVRDSRCHGPGFLRIDAHLLPQTALHISPLFAGALYAAPNGRGPFLFCFAEIIDQTHFISPFMLGMSLHTKASSVMQPLGCWKLLLDAELSRLMPN